MWLPTPSELTLLQMKLPDESRFPGSEGSWLPGAKQPARTADEFVAWISCRQMEPILDGLATSARRMKEEMGADDLAGKRGLWLLLAIEAMCRQQTSVALPADNDAEMLEGIGIMSEMLIAAAGAYGKPEPLSSQQFWRDFIVGLSMAWALPAMTLKLDPNRLYAVQIRRIRDSSGPGSFGH